MQRFSQQLIRTKTLSTIETKLQPYSDCALIDKLIQVCNGTYTLPEVQTELLSTMPFTFGGSIENIRRDGAWCWEDSIDPNLITNKEWQDVLAHVLILTDYFTKISTGALLRLITQYHIPGKIDTRLRNKSVGHLDIGTKLHLYQILLALCPTESKLATYARLGFGEIALGVDEATEAQRHVVLEDPHFKGVMLVTRFINK